MNRPCGRASWRPLRFRMHPDIVTDAVFIIGEWKMWTRRSTLVLRPNGNLQKHPRLTSASAFLRFYLFVEYRYLLTWKDCQGNRSRIRIRCKISCSQQLLDGRLLVFVSRYSSSEQNYAADKFCSSEVWIETDKMTKQHSNILVTISEAGRSCSVDLELHSVSKLRELVLGVHLSTETFFVLKLVLMRIPMSQEAMYRQRFALCTTFQFFHAQGWYWRKCFADVMYCGKSLCLKIKRVEQLETSTSTAVWSSH